MHSQSEQLIKMANQIGTSIGFQVNGEPGAVHDAIAAHLKMFWAPSMRAQLIADLDAGQADEIRPVVRTALTTNRVLLLKQAGQVHGATAPVEPEGGGDAG
jgi:formate dehydrogenase subunit delta